ncbi:BatB ABC-type amino acid transport system, permease component [Candidatus Pelagibacterales bacterium]
MFLTSQFKTSLRKNLQLSKLLPQLLLIILFCYIIYFFTKNTQINLAARNLNFGFDFLKTNSGFDVQFSLIQYDGSSSYLRSYLVGLLNTLLVSFFGIIFATILGFIVGISRLSPNWIVNKLSLIYVELFRNLPLLLQIFFWYFVVIRSLPSTEKSTVILNFLIINLQGFYIPKFIFSNFIYIFYGFVLALLTTFIVKYYATKAFYESGKIIPVFKIFLLLIIIFPVIFSLIGDVSLSVEYPKLIKNFGIFNYVGGVKLVPEFLALLFSLSLYTSAFIAENVRAGILAISKGQKEASKSLGFNNPQTLKLIVIPQALRVIIPPTTNQYLNLTKNSSLAAAIGYPDLAGVFAGTALSQTGKAIEIIFMVMMTYLTISLIISGILNWYNKKIAIVER